MKRVFALMLVLCLLLCGCGQEAPETTAPTTEPVTTPTTEPATNPATEPTTVPTTVPVETTEPLTVYTHPLTGLALDEPFTTRPTAIMINNLVNAVPQCGISQADILYEILAEGSVTRFMAIFTDLENVDVIGPVRSVRPYFVRVAQHYDAILCSAGGSDEAYSLIDSLGYDYLNAIGGASNYFYRDEWRKNNKGFEHSLMTTGEDLAAAAVRRGVETTAEDQDYGLTFDDAAIPAGEDATEIDIHFYKNGKLTRMTWDQETNLYSMYQHRQDALDGNDDMEVAFRNVLVLRASTRVTDGVGHLEVQMTGEGEGYFARDGKIIPIRWSRDDNTDLYSYTDLDGNPISLGVGRSYIAIVPVESNVDYSA